MSKIAKFCKKHNNIFLAGIVLLYFAVMIPVMKHFNVSCFFRHFFGIICPGCGMTRAVLSVFRLDFAAAFRYNPLVFALPYIGLYILFDFKAKAHKYILAGIGILFLLNWVIRLAVPSLQPV